MWVNGVWVALLGVLWVLTLARCGYLRSTYADRATNVYRVLHTLGCTLVFPPAEHCIPQVWAVNVALICFIVGVQVSTALTLRLTPRQVPWRRQAEWLSPPVIVISPAALILLSYPAWSRGRTPFDQPSPALLGYWLFFVIPAWIGIGLLMPTFVAGLRAGPTRGEAITHLFGIVTFGFALAMSVVELTNAGLLAAGDRTGLAEWLLATFPYFRLCMTVAISTLFAVPLMQLLAHRFELDRWSRRRRRLTPLWNDLTAACPEIIHLAPTTAATTDSRYRLHRTIVEIRDSMLILARYTTALPTELADTLAARPHQPAFLSAVQLARAAAAKTLGEAPRNNLTAQRSAARDLLADANELTRIARIWPHAKTIARQLAPNAR
jgi:hypothetical protein